MLTTGFLALSAANAEILKISNIRIKIAFIRKAIVGT